MSRIRYFTLCGLLAALLAIFPLACKRAPKEKPGTPTPTAAQPQAPGQAPTAQPTVAPAPVSWRPSIIAQGLPRRLPDEIVFRFPRETADPALVGGPAGKDAVVKITPAAEGQVIWRDRSSLVFTPKPPLAFETNYEVELEKVMTPVGLVRPEAGESWRISFTTPGFGLTGVDLEKVDFKQNEAWLVLHWTGPVSLPSLTEHAHVYLEKKGVPQFEFQPQAHWEQVALKVKLPVFLTEPKPLELVLDSGVTSGDGRVKTPLQTRHEITLKEPKRIRITGVSPQEGQSGFYLQVNCEDEAARREEDQYWYHTNRCDLPSDAIQEYVEFTPALKFSTVAVRDGFRVFAEFKRGSYSLVISPGLHSNQGGVLTRAYEATVTIPARRPKVSFVSKGRYLPASQVGNLPVSHLNVPALSLVIRQIPEKNLVFWMSGSVEKADDRISDIIARRVIPVSSPEDLAQTTWLDLRQEVAEAGKGVFELTLVGGETVPAAAAKAAPAVEPEEENEECEGCEGDEPRRAREPEDKNFRRLTAADTTRLILTDLAVVVKQAGESGRDLEVWVLGMEDNQPRSGAKVTVMTSSNRSLAECSTDSAGACRLHGVADSIAGKAPFALVVSKGDDLTALRFSDLKVQTADADVQGPPYRQAQPYRAAIYADRGVYRPGETAHLVAIVRGDDDRAPAGELPVLGRLLDPRKKEVQQLRGKTNPAGLVAFDLSFQAFAATGKYELSLEIAGNPISSLAFNVEEFVPERMKVKVEPGQKAFLQSEELPVLVEAKYLFGAVASGEKVELECLLKEGQFRPEKNGEYNYSVWRPEPLRALPLGTVTGNLDEKGRVTLSCPAVEAATSFRGPGLVEAQASVFESGSGRTTVSRASVPVHPAKIYVGLRSDKEKAKAGEKLTIEGVVVDWEGNLVPDERKVEVRISNLESDWVYEYDDQRGRYTYRRFQRELAQGTELLTVKGGKFSYTYTPAGYAEGWIFRVQAEGNASTDLMIPREGYWWWGEGGEYVSSAENTPKPQRPATMPIEAPAEIRVGQEASVTVKPPYPGRLLFTVETDQVLESRWLEVEAKPTPISFKIEKFAPNVYVTALLLKNPHQESEKAFLPGRAFAIKSIAIAPEANRMSLELKAPSEVRPRQELVIELQASPEEQPLYATVAAVDEGILQLTNYRNPDPLAQLFAKRALGVDTFETVGWSLLVPALGEGKSPGGGEEGAQGPGRIPPVKPVALWSGVVNLDESGKARVRFQVPQYRGSLRVVAVAVGPSRVGVAAANVTVREPLVIQTTFPRFLINDDRFVVPVFLTNLTDRPESVEVEFQTGESVRVEGDATKPIELAPNASGTVTFVARANAAFGAADFKVIARGKRNRSEDTAQIPFLPNAPVTREVSQIKLQPGKNDLSKSLLGWTPQYEQTSVWVTASPYGQEFTHLKYLICYPYGCVEQTVSTTRPLLYMGQLLGSIDPASAKDLKIEEKFMHGVNHLLTMQTSAGGFAMWPGGQDPTLWGTAFVTYLFLQGKEAGYPIPEDSLNQAVSFMQNALNSGNQETDYHGDRMGSSEPFMQYVLAVAGHGRKGRIKQLLEKPDSGWGEMKEENLYLLKAALYLAGDRTYTADLKKLEVTISDHRINNWSFWSELRTRGLQLNIVEDVYPHSAEAERLAQAVASRLRENQSGHLNTQEISWTVSGLGKRASVGASEWSPPELYLDGKKMQPLPKQQKTKGKEATWQIAGASGSKSLDLKVDKIEGGDLYAVVTVEGIKLGVPYALGDHTLKVSREYRNQAGEKLNLQNLKLGEVVYVDLSLQNLGNEQIQNVVLVDRFGAGLEIENPRLSREHAMDWASSLWEVTYLNMRDDQIEFFGHLAPKTTVRQVYVLRAVTAGEFTTPPVKAEAMYEPRYWSAAPGSPARILDPWQALTQ